MIDDIQDAVDEMHALFIQAWGLINPIVWPDVAHQIPDANTSWARVSVLHTVGEQASLANHNGVRQWHRMGVYTVQIFTPCGSGMKKAYELGEKVMKAFQGKDTVKGLWFKDVILREIGADGTWQQVNVTINFVYTQYK